VFCHTGTLTLITRLSQLHCAKMVEQMKMLFVVNTPGGSCNIVLDMGPFPLTEKGRGLTFKF